MFVCVCVKWRSATVSYIWWASHHLYATWQPPWGSEVVKQVKLRFTWRLRSRPEASPHQLLHLEPVFHDHIAILQWHITNPNHTKIYIFVPFFSSQIKVKGGVQCECLTCWKHKLQRSWSWSVVLRYTCQYLFSRTATAEFQLHLCYVICMQMQFGKADGVTFLQKCNKNGISAELKKAKAKGRKVSR